MRKFCRNGHFLATIVCVCFFNHSGMASGRPLLHMAPPKLGLGLTYEIEEEEHSATLGKDTKERLKVWRERLEIETRGWVYHPALCNFTLRFEPEWSQTEKAGKGQEDQDHDDYSPAYYADLTFLEKKPYTLTLFAQRNETILNSAFANRSETTTDSYGGALRLSNRVLPMSLSYAHRDSTQEGFYASEEQSDDWRLVMTHNTTNSGTHLRSGYHEKERTSETLLTRTETTDGEIRNTVDLPSAKRIRLATTLGYRQTESNIYETKNLRFSETLDWHHSRTLDSAYRLNYYQNQSGDFDTSTSALGARLTHRLYENLTTNVSVGTEKNTYNRGEEVNYDTQLDLAYRRAIPWGMIFVNVGQNFQTTFRALDQKVIQVSGERLTLTTGEVTLLGNANVEISSIVVTDLSGTPYLLNIDYTLTQINNDVRVSRTAFGGIADGELVLAQYRYLSSPDFDDSIYSQSYGISLNLGQALSLDYSYQHAGQHLLSGKDPGNLMDDTVHTTHMRYHLNWSDTYAVYTDSQKNSGLSTRRWFVEQSLRHGFSRQLFGSLSGRYGKIFFKESDETEAFYGGRAHLDWMPTYWCQVNATGYQNHVIGETRETVDTGLSACIEMVYRIWSTKLSFESANEEELTQDRGRTRYILRFELIRKLW